MSRHKKHRRRRKSSFKLEPFLINRGLQIAGILLIIAGMIYLLTSNLNLHFIDNLLNSFMKSKPEQPVVVSNAGSSLPGYLSNLLFIPGILLLAGAYFLPVQKNLLRNFLFLMGYAWLIISEGRVLLNIRYHHIELSYYFILALFCMVQIVSTAIAMAGKSRTALIGSVIFFFASLIMIRYIYGAIIPLIIFLILFQLAVSLYCFRNHWRFPFVLLMALSAVYLAYYFLKFVIVPKDAGQGIMFMMPGLFTWFVLTITGLGILKPDSMRKRKSVTWDVLSYLALLLVAGLSLGSWYRSGPGTISILYFSMAVFSLIVIAFLNRKRDFIKNSDPFFFSFCIFSSLWLPQLFFVDFLLLLPASLALALLINVLLTDSKISFHISMGLFYIMLGLLVIEWASKYIPALLLQRSAGTNYSFRMILNSLLVFALSYAYYRLFTRVLHEYSFSQAQSRTYKNSVRAVYSLIFYLSGFLLLDEFLILILPGYRVNLIEWGLYTYSFLYFLMRSQNVKSRTRLRYTLLLSVPAVIIYPLFLHPETIHFRTLYLAGNSSALVPFLMHYLCLGMMALLILEADSRIRKLFPKNRQLARVRQVLGIVFLCFILLSEYDHLALIIFDRLSSQPAYEILQYNIFIPYSVILLFVSVVLLVYSLLHYTRFLRRLSMFMILAVLLKVFFVDIKILPVKAGVALLISLGVILLAVSFLIPGFSLRSRESQSQAAEAVKPLQESENEGLRDE